MRAHRTTRHREGRGDGAFEIKRNRPVLPERLRALLMRAEDGVWVTTLDSRIVFWNRAAEAVLGLGALDVCGRSCAEVLTGYNAIGEPVCGPGCGVPQCIGTTFGLPTHGKDGRKVWLEVLTFTTNGNTSPSLVIHVFQDATRTKQLLRDLRAYISHSGEGEHLLTARELQILRLIAEGVRTAAAAERLRVSRATIRNHIQNIFGKLGVHTRLEAVAYARRHRLL